MHKKHLAVVPAVAALLAATTLGAQAVEIVVNSGDTVGSQSISGVGDSLLVEAGGVIEVFTGSTYPVYSTGANNTLVNFGGIYSYADCSYGIYAMGNYFSLTNNGQIETTNWASAGIYVAPSDNNALDTQILNNGMIWTQGEESHAISVYGTGTRITNDGSVLTSGDGSVGIYTWARNPGSDVVIVNTGVVYATGESYTNSSSFVIDAHAIQSKAPGAHIINSGIVISEQADAFALDAADQTLTMLAGSTVYGGIRFANADSGTLNLGSNLDAVLTITANPGQDLDDLTINAESGMLGVTRISATEHVVTVVSPQTVQAGTAAAANVTGSVGTMIAGHTGDRRQGLSGGSALLGYAPSPAAPAFPDFAPSDDFGIWASGYGTISAPTGDNVGATSRQGGGLVGSDIKLADDMLIGAFAGVGYGTIDGNGPNLSTTSLVGGGYASLALGTAFIDLSGAIGATINESSRRIVNNKVPAGYETATGSYTGLFASPSIKLGFDQDLGAARLTPSIALMYAGIYQNGYTETGATTPLTMGSQFSHILNARAELEIGSLKSDDTINGWNGSFKLGADGTVIAGGAVAANIMGTALNLAGTSAFEARGFVGANAEYKSGAYTFSASTELGYSTNGIFSASIRGGLGARF